MVRDGNGKAVGFEIVETEAEAIRSVVDRLIDGTVSLAGVAREWDAKGISTASGGMWSGASARGTGGGGILVGKMLRQARLAGLLEYRGEIVGRSEYIPAILDQQTWRHLVRVLDARVRTSGAARRGALLTGKDSPAQCSECGGPLTVANLKPRAAEQKERFLKCVNGHVVMSEREVEAEVLGRAILAADLYGVSILPTEPVADVTVELARLKELDAELNMYRDALVTRKVILDGVTVPVTAATVLPAIAQLEREQAELQKTVDAANTAVQKVVTPGDLRRVLADFNDLDLEHRRAIVSRLYASIVVHRRYADQPDDAARVVMTFAEGFVPADSPVATRAVSGAAVMHGEDEPADDFFAASWRFADE